MASRERAVVLMMIMMMMMMGGMEVTQGAVYKVGDSAGWTTIGNIDYKKWASSKNFKVGDNIIFEYNPKFHNVMRMTHPMYKSCNVSSTPLATFTTGNDSIKITSHGHHFFVCGAPGHCQASQKVDINVITVFASAIAKASSPSPLASPMSPPSNVPAPSPNKAVPFVALKGAFSVMGLAFPFFALFAAFLGLLDVEGNVFVGVSFLSWLKGLFL